MTKRKNAHGLTTDQSNQTMGNKTAMYNGLISQNSAIIASVGNQGAPVMVGAEALGAMLGAHPYTVTRWAREGKIRGYRFSSKGEWRFVPMQVLQDLGVM